MYYLLIYYIFHYYCMAYSFIITCSISLFIKYCKYFYLFCIPVCIYYYLCLCWLIFFQHLKTKKLYIFILFTPCLVIFLQSHSMSLWLADERVTPPLPVQKPGLFVLLIWALEQSESFQLPCMHFLFKNPTLRFKNWAITEI